ncbi:MAG: helix-hairpin-helix domain-containing protein [Holophagaceae bacterium]|uniref:Helix-hairpin-helix domain-containing protein n=1 Tax=Candidatus Geothrix skivensis TaxID=2954439 RepID=A0A9D7SHM6_9BACT|nr:helix-hairpin-helix domain-containing protein [Candidatus Geothrix skivensis]
MTIRRHSPLFAALLLAMAPLPALRAQEPAPTKQGAPTPKAVTPPAAADGKATTAPRPKAPAQAPKASAPAPKAAAKPEAVLPRTKGKLKPVKLNSATKEQIGFMLGMDADLAARIVAARPFKTKAELVTRGLISQATYSTLKDRVVADAVKAPAK